VLATSLTSSLGGLGCAKPCFDDGLAQGGCPEGETDPSATVTATMGDATATASATSPDGTATEPGTGGNTGLDCPTLDEVLLPQIPTFQLVIDQSGSMNQGFGGAITRWEAVESTLVGPDGVVTQLQSSIRFGASFYANPMGAATCPDVNTIPPALDAAADIAQLFQSESPGGDTPTGESIELITAQLLQDTWDGDKVMVLATDGEPDTCAVPEPSNQAQVDQVRGVAVNAVAAAYDAGIRTFIISVGPEIAASHLQDLANAGVGQPANGDAEFYVANDTASLVAAFNAIVAGLRPCTFSLEDPLPPSLAPACSLTVNDTPVPYDDPNGWTVQGDETTLELRGSACESIQEGVVAIALQCSCES
jgi:hypothetical protein